MGQQQGKTLQKEIQSYPQQKPSQIHRLQYYIQRAQYRLVNPYDSEYEQNQYQLILTSFNSSNYKYGLKVSNPHYLKKDSLSVQNFCQFVQIYLIPEHQKQSHILVFQGQIVNGKRSHFGVEYNKKGQIIYQGFFKNNKYHGWGFTPIYEGQWFEGTKYGYGVYSSFKNQSSKKNFKYQGMWKNDSFNGLGAKNIPVKQTQIFLKPEFQQPDLKVEDQYIGEWLDGLKCGCGKSIIYSHQDDKQVYQGEFANNHYQGHGRLKKDSQEFVQGTFQAGKLIKNS